MAPGLSPPARGSQGGERQTYDSTRSIPARAGEPLRSCLVSSGSTVYPRPRGGAVDYQLDAWSVGGLSPPARGSPDTAMQAMVEDGSIPARAGEPGTANRGRRREEVYPRPRGGAGIEGEYISQVTGLSPPARGSHYYEASIAGSIGSIPARAGEPAPCPRCLCGEGVYPRPRGGALVRMPLIW